MNISAVTIFLARVVDTGVATPMLKRRSLFERCVTLPVGTWSVARKQSFRCVGGHVHNLTTPYFERQETTTLAKKKNHPRDLRREERCSTCDIMLDQARSAQGKSRGQSRIGLAPALIAPDRA